MTWLSELRTWKYNGIQINRLCLYDEWSYVLQNVRHEYFYPFVRAKCYLQKLWIGNISRLPHAQETRDNKIQHIVNVHNQDADNASILFPGDKLACCFICIDFFKYVFKLFLDKWYLENSITLAAKFSQHMLHHLVCSFSFFLSFDASMS